MMKKKSIPQDLLKPQHNIWRDANAEQLAILIDGENYFSEVYQAITQAEQQILILGWDIHSLVVLRPDVDKLHGGDTLHKIMNNVACEKPNLAIYILVWDFSTLIYSIEREALQSVKFGWMSAKNIHFFFDSECPVGASHHQKVVVIDNHLAFCGGMDLTANRWDSSQHEPDDPLRVLPNGERYAPFHDVQLAVTGAAATALGDLARERWLRATGQALIKPKGKFAVGISKKIDDKLIASNARIGISRTMPGFRLRQECREVENLYLDMIQIAQEYIYIENQYLTASRIVTALFNVLQGSHGPEIVIVLPKRAGGWLETNTLGLLQNAAIRKLKQADHQHRLKVVFPDDLRLQGESYITVHSKVMIVDGVIARVGSANLNHRSMGLDTECDIVIDASKNDQTKIVIRHFLASLLAEHCGVAVDKVSALLKNHSLLDIMTKLTDNDRDKNLIDMPVDDEQLSEFEQTVAESELLDMERPSKIEESLDQWAFLAETSGHQDTFLKRHWGAILTAVVAIGIAILMGLTPDELAKHTQFIEGPLELFLVVLGLFVLSGVAFVPLNLLIIVGASILPSWQAFLLVFLGTIGSAASGYLVGRAMNDQLFTKLFGKRSKKIVRRLGHGGLASILSVRLVPVASHALINLTAGFSRVKFWQFILGTAIGCLPGSILLVIFQRNLIDLIRDFSFSGVLMLILILAIVLSVIYLLMTRFSKYLKGSA